MINFVVVFVLFYQKIKNNTKTTTKLSHINALNKTYGITSVPFCH